MPATNADAFRALGSAGLIDDDLAVALAGAAGFRNVLVHDYVEVDDALVVQHLDDIDRLRAFVAAASRLLTESSE